MFFYTKNVTKSYGGKEIIKDISISIKKSESVALLGVSGIGKTTLFNIASGLELPDYGQVFLEDEEITGISGNVGYMQQKDLLLPFRTIAQNVSIPLLLKGKDKKEAFETAKEMLPKFGLIDVHDKYPAQLSGGMRQRAALLRTYLFSNKLLLLDEPFSALDAITRSNMQDWFISVVKETNIPTLFITHDIDEAIILSDRIYIMSGIPGMITDELVVDIKKENSSDLVLSDEFRDFKQRILKSIKKSLLKGF